MKDDVLDRLKAKEDELEAFVADAKRRCAELREAAVQKAREIRGSAARSIEARAKELVAEHEAEIEKITQAVEADSTRAAEDIRRAGEAGMGAAVKAVLKRVI